MTKIPGRNSLKEEAVGSFKRIWSILIRKAGGVNGIAIVHE